MRSGRRNSGSTAAPSPLSLQEPSQEVGNRARRTRDPSPRTNRTLKHVNGDSPRSAVRGLEEQLNELAAAPPAARQGSLRNLLKQGSGSAGKPPSRGTASKEMAENNPSPPASRASVRSGSAGSHRRPISADRVSPPSSSRGRSKLQLATKEEDQSVLSDRAGVTSAVAPKNAAADEDFEFDDGKSTPITSDMLDKALENSDSPSLIKLTVLTLSAMHICDIRGLNSLQSLRHLDLSFNRIKDIFGLEGLIQLRELRLTCNKITRLDGIQKLTALEELHIQVNRIAEIGKGALANCRKLRTLRIDGNCLDALAPHTDRLVAVTALDASSNRLTKIQGLSMMAQMEELNLSYNSIGALEGLGAFARLQELNLVGNQLDSLAGLRSCGQLRVLRVNDNQIGDLKGLQRVPLLEELYVGGNQLTKCGELIAGACPNLEFLDISRNKLSDLNEVQRVGSLSCLIDLKLAGNPLCQNELYPQRARQFLSAVDTVDDQDFRGLRIKAAQEEEDAAEGGGAANGAEEGEGATGTVLDRGGVTVDKHRKYKELADVLTVEEFESQIRGLHTGIQSVKQNLKDEMYRAMYPPEDQRPKRPSELAEEALAKKRAAKAADAVKQAGRTTRGRGAADGGAAPRASGGNKLEVSDKMAALYERGNQLVAKALQRIGKSSWDTGPAVAGSAGASPSKPALALRSGGGGEEEERAGYLQSERLAGREAQLEGKAEAEAEDSRESGEMHEAVARFNSELNKRLAATNRQLLREVEQDGQDQLSPALEPPRSPIPFPLKDQRRAEGQRMKEAMEDLRRGEQRAEDPDQGEQQSEDGGMAAARTSSAMGVDGGRGRRGSEGEIQTGASRAEEERQRPASSRPVADGPAAAGGMAKRAVLEEKRHAGEEDGGAGVGEAAAAARAGEAGPEEPQEITEGWEDEFYGVDSRPSTSASRLRDDGAGSRPGTGNSRVREKLSEARQLAASVAQGDA